MSQDSTSVFISVQQYIAYMLSRLYAIPCSSVRLSVHPSVRLVDHRKGWS